MQIMEKIRKITRPPFQLEPEKYVIGYEDTDHPCYNCIIKGMCTLMCQPMWQYGQNMRWYLRSVAENLVPENFKNFHVSYSNENLLNMLKTLKGSVAHDIFLDNEMYESIQRAQAHINRKQLIRKNYRNKHGETITSLSSSTQSGVSLSSISQSTQPKKRRTNEPYPAKTNVVPGLNKGQGSRKHIRPRNY
jgi:hypothetical protein